MTEPIQNKPVQLPSPRVRITYAVSHGDTVLQQELPFIACILADLSGDVAAGKPLPQLHERKMLDIDRDNFNDVMQMIAPRVDLLPIRYQEALSGVKNGGKAQDHELIFNSLDDFSPLNVVQAVPALKAKYLERRQIRSAPASAESDEAIRQIDQQLSAALSCIMHSPSFKALEQSWRGLAYLVRNTATSTLLKLRVFNATKEALQQDMQKAVEIEQSALFNMICEAEYGTLGGHPYSLLVGDYEIGSGVDDIDFLKNISAVAAAAHAPFLAAAAAAMFGLTDFNKRDKPRALKTIFASLELAPWRAFRHTEDARYVALVLPRALLRLPCGSVEKGGTMQCEGFNFDEQCAAPASGTGDFLWGNAAYLLAERITNAFALYGWTAAINGVEGGGLVTGLLSSACTSDAGTTDVVGPTEVAITDARRKELSELGFISLCQCEETGRAAFFDNQTTYAPAPYFSDETDADARISATLPYLLAASRFAQYVKVIMRHKVGSFLTRANVEAYLNNWIANYVLLDDNPSQEINATYPLRAASVVITEVAGAPGAYKATLFLRPHFQLEALTTSIRLVVDLPQ